MHRHISASNCKIEKKKGFVGFFPKLTYLYSAGGSAVRPSLTPSNTYIKSTPDHSCIMKTESDQLCVISAQCNSGALGMNSVCTVLGKDRGQLLCCEPKFLLIKPSSLCATLLQRLVLWLQLYTVYKPPHTPKVLIMFLKQAATCGQVQFIQKWVGSIDCPVKMLLFIVGIISPYRYILL